MPTNYTNASHQTTEELYNHLSITALGMLMSTDDYTTYQIDCFRWLRQVYSRASIEPDLLEVYSLSVLPSS